jgi:hypothetical protein
MIVVDGERKNRYYCQYDDLSNVAALLNINGGIEKKHGPYK